MLYHLNTLSREELERLYITESQKLSAAMKGNIAYNTLQSIRMNLVHIENKLQTSAMHRNEHVLQPAYK